MKKISVVDVILFALLGVYPFVMSQGYINILWGKYVFFLFTIIFAVAFFTIRGIARWFSADELIDFAKIREILSKWNGIDKAVALFVVASTLSLILSTNRNMSFFGREDMYMGYLFTCMCIFLYVIVRTTVWNSDIVTVVIHLGLIIQVLLSVLQFCGVDFFGMIEQILESARINYLSTWGNTCIFGIYLIFAGTVVLFTYCTTDKVYMRRLSGIGCVATYIGVLIANTDATFLGLFFAILGIMRYTSKDRKQICRFSHILFYFAVAAVILQLLFVCFENHRPISGLGRIGMSWTLCIVMLVVGLVLLVFLKNEKVKEPTIRIISLGIWYFVLALVVIVVIAVVYFSVLNRETELGKLGNYLRFSETWGTGRGYIWSMVMEIYSDFSWSEKLFGIGQASMAPLLMGQYSARMFEEIHYYFDNAHNVYLQYLITIGLFGVVTYLAIIITLVGKLLKNEVDGLGIATGIALVACGIMDVVSILQPITMPLFWVFLAISAKMGKK